MRRLIGFAIVLLSAHGACQAQDTRYHDHDEFDVVCKESGTGPGRKEFQVVIRESEVEITNKETGEHLPAAMYVNAFAFVEKDVEWLLDRFAGTLSSKPPGKVYGCAKNGGRRF